MPQRVPVKKERQRVPVEKERQRVPVTEPQVDETTWMEAVGGLRPDRLAVSFARGAWQTIIGVPGLLSVAPQLAKELAKQGGTHPIKSRVRGAGLSEERISELSKSIYDFDSPDYAKEFPLITAIIEDYGDRLGSVENIKKTLKEDPYSILSELLPILAKLGKTGKLGKYSRIVKRGAEVADPTNLPGEVLNVAGRATEKAFKPYAKQYNPDITAKYGRDAQGKDLETTKSAEALATEYGAGVKDTPGMVLSDAKNVQLREGIQLHSESEIAEPVAERFKDTKESLEQSGRAMVGSDSADVFDPEAAGERVIENFGKIQDGHRGDFARKYGAIKEQTDALVVPERGFEIPITDAYGEVVDINFIPSPYQTYFQNTSDVIQDLKSSDSKLLPSSEYQKVINIFEGVFQKVEQGGWTVRDMDRLRTNFRTELDLAVKNGQITPVGAGTVASKVYGALTKDFYDTLEFMVNREPDQFPDNFVDSVKVAKAEYAQVQQLLETSAGKYLLRNQHKPAQIVEYALTTMTSKDIGDLKQLIGDQGWASLKPALLSRIIDKSLTNDRWTPGGLKRAIAGVNSMKKNRVRELFGDDAAIKLSELAEFSTRLQREARVSSNSPTGFINNMIQKGNLGHLMFYVGEVGYAAGMGFGADTSHLIIGLTTFGVHLLGRKAFNSFINSDNGREWMLKGETYKVRFGDKDIPIKPQDFRRALAYPKKKGSGVAYTTRTTQRAKERQEKKQRTGGFGRRSFGRVGPLLVQ